MSVVSIADFVKHQESQGCKLISCIDGLQVQKALAKGDNSTPLPDPDIKDGIYNLVQVRWGAGSSMETINASIPLISPSSTTGDLPVTMTAPSVGNENLWRLIAAYGSKNGYFIVPNVTPGASTDLGGTTFDVGGVVKVRRNDSYPVWQLRCDLRTTYRKEDGTYEDKYYYRILEIGSAKCWTTNGNFEVHIDSTSDAQRFDQLFELIQVVPEQTFVIQSTQPINVTAHDAGLQRRLWVASGQLTKDQLSRMVSCQLSTNARDQGWASNPNQGVWTWFELCILNGPTSSDEFTDKDIKRDANGAMLTYFSHTTELSSEYKDQTGKLFDKDSELWKNVEAGNLIGVLACAQFRAWSLDGRIAKLAFKEILA